MAQSVVTAERFAKGMTFEQYVAYAGSKENLAREAFGSYYPDGGAIGAPRKDNSAVLRDRYARLRLADYQVAAIKWLAAQPGGPANILMISEDWSSDCRRDAPAMARLAEAGGLQLRIFNRDGAEDAGPAAARSGRLPGRQPRPDARVPERQGRRGVGVGAGGGDLHQGLPRAAPLPRVPRDLSQGRGAGPSAGRARRARARSRRTIAA